MRGVFVVFGGFFAATVACNSTLPCTDADASLEVVVRLEDTRTADRAESLIVLLARPDQRRRRHVFELSADQLKDGATSFWVEFHDRPTQPFPVEVRVFAMSRALGEGEVVGEQTHKIDATPNGCNRLEMALRDVPEIVDPGWTGTSTKVVTARRAKAGSIQIDGAIDEPEWNLVPRKLKTFRQPNGLGWTADAQFAALWDDDALYVAVRVWDDVLNKNSTDTADGNLAFLDDAAELYLDGNPATATSSLTGGYECRTGEACFEWQIVRSIANHPLYPLHRAPPAKVQTIAHAAKELPGNHQFPFGYGVEFRVPWSIFVANNFPFSPVSGGCYGFEIEIDDDDVTTTSPPRDEIDGYAVWHSDGPGKTCQPHLGSCGHGRVCLDGTLSRSNRRTPPRLLLEGPEVTGNIVALRGTAFDVDGRVVQVRAVNEYVSDVVATGTTEFKIEGLRLKSGTNRITVMALDEDGNVGSAKIELEHK